MRTTKTTTARPKEDGGLHVFPGRPRIIAELEREQKMELYVWVDALRLTAKPKKHFARDFSDGVLVAEIVHQSRVARDNGVVVSMHNYPVKNSFKGKMENWEMLNAKVLRSAALRCELTREEMSAVARCEKDAAEKVLLKIKTALEDDCVSIEKEEDEDEDQKDRSDQEASSERASTDEAHHRQTLRTLAPERRDDELDCKQQQQQQQQQLQPERARDDRAASGETNQKNRDRDREDQGIDDDFWSRDEKEKDVVISRLTAKVDALTAKCGKLEQLLEVKEKRLESLVVRCHGAKPPS